MELAPLLSSLERLWNDETFAALAEFRESHPGARVIGTFPVYVPEELIHAAGFLPAQLHGAGQLVEIERADSRIQSFVCSISRSTLELALRGLIPMVDGFVFPSICDVSRNLAGVWKRNFPDHWVAYVHWPENATSAHARGYLVSELTRLRRELEELRGRPIEDGEIWESIRTYDENRRLVGELYRLRREHPEKLSLSESYRLVRAGGFLRRDEHNRILERALALAREREGKPRDVVPVVLEGSFCELPPLELLEILEECGCHVVDDDLLLATRWYRAPIDGAGGDPLEALAEAFLTRTRPSAVHHPGPEDRVRELAERAEALGAQGVIFANAKFCEPALYDFVLLKEELERRGVPYLFFEFEEKMGVFDHIRSQVETFVEAILFYGDEVGAAAGWRAMEARREA